MTNECSSYRDDLPLFLFGELPPPRRNDIAAHLATCSGCATEINQLRTWKERVREAARVEADAAFWQTYRRTLRGRLPQRRKRFPGRPRPAFVALLGILLAGGIAVWMIPKPHPPSGHAPEPDHPAAMETLDLVQNLGMFENLSLLEEMDALDETGGGADIERLAQ